MKIQMENHVTVKRISSNNEFEALKDIWNSLLDNSPSDCFFLRWEWLWAWWKAYEDETTELSILLFYQKEELIGIGPFYLARLSWKKIFKKKSLMFLGTKTGDIISEYMDFIYIQGKEEEVVEEFVSFITEKIQCDSVDLHEIIATSPTIGLLQKYAIKSGLYFFTGKKNVVPYIQLGENMEMYFKTLSKAMRYKIERNSKKIKNMNDVSFHKTGNSRELERDFAELVRLHQMRWESKAHEGAFSDKNFFAFQKNIMEFMVENGNLNLSFLSVSGKNIASQYNIIYKEKLYFYQGGIDTSFYRNLSPGYLLHVYCIEEATKNGFKEYDFLVSDNKNTFKKHWTKEFKYMIDINIAVSRPYKLSQGVKHRILRICGYSD